MEPIANKWEPTRWWRVVDPAGKLWCETSSEYEARSWMREGDTLEHLHSQIFYEWIPE
jgi:hypothetical protein